VGFSFLAGSGFQRRFPSSGATKGSQSSATVQFLVSSVIAVIIARFHLYEFLLKSGSIGIPTSGETPAK
jgi:hypothetical protein